jgi:hypothetical protein
MTIQDAAALADQPRSFSALAEQLRDGPLQQLIEIQLQANALANRLDDSPADRIEDLERLVQLSLAAMERFHTFTREFAAVLQALTDVRRYPH